MLLVIGALAIATGVALSAFSYRAVLLAGVPSLLCTALAMSSTGWNVLSIVVACLAVLLLQQAAYLAGVAWRVRVKAKADRTLGAMRSKSS
ncbi:membrane protein implicated in regulation of membrane protease activity [Nitrobacteraceae bacterium AZCC 2161]